MSFRLNHSVLQYMVEQVMLVMEGHMDRKTTMVAGYIYHNHEPQLRYMVHMCIVNYGHENYLMGYSHEADHKNIWYFGRLESHKVSYCGEGAPPSILLADYE